MSSETKPQLSLAKCLEMMRLTTEELWAILDEDVRALRDASTKRDGTSPNRGGEGSKIGR